MNDHTHDQPPTLREVLDRGEDLADYVSTDCFEDHVEEVAAGFRSRDRILALLDWYLVPIPGCEEVRHAAKAELLWSLELVDHPDLLARVLTLLPAVEVRLHERSYAERHPYPLAVSVPSARSDGTVWRCQSCGIDFTDNTIEALVIDNPPSYGGELPHPLHYCYSCLTMAIEAFSPN